MMQHSACNSQGITQRLWKQRLGDRDEYSQEDCSRNADGNVPDVYWNADNGKVNVNWYNVDEASQQYGLRQKF